MCVLWMLTFGLPGLARQPVASAAGIRGWKAYRITGRKRAAGVPEEDVIPPAHLHGLSNCRLVVRGGVPCAVMVEIVEDTVGRGRPPGTAVMHGRWCEAKD